MFVEKLNSKISMVLVGSHGIYATTRITIIGLAIVVYKFIIKQVKFNCQHDNEK